MSEPKVVYVKCPRCGHPSRTRREYIGKRARCKLCDSWFMISESALEPETSDMAAAAAEQIQAESSAYLPSERSFDPPAYGKVKIASVAFYIIGLISSAFGGATAVAGILMLLSRERYDEGLWALYLAWPSLALGIILVGVSGILDCIRGATINSHFRKEYAERQLEALHALVSNQSQNRRRT